MSVSVADVSMVACASATTVKAFGDPSVTKSAKSAGSVTAPPVLLGPLFTTSLHYVVSLQAEQDIASSSLPIGVVLTG